MIRSKEIIMLGVVLVFLGLAYSYVGDAKTDALIAGERVRVLEVERKELEVSLEKATQDYEILRDSLDYAHDSIAEVRADAVERAVEASESFTDNMGILRDSLEIYEGLRPVFDQIQEDHDREVSAYQDQVETLETENLMLWRRVTVIDSIWSMDQRVNASLRREITALNAESDAWERVAKGSLFGKIRSGVPYAIIGGGIAMLMLDD